MGNLCGGGKQSWSLNMHRAAEEGDVSKLKELILEGHSIEKVAQLSTAADFPL